MSGITMKTQDVIDHVVDAEARVIDAIRGCMYAESEEEWDAICSAGADAACEYELWSWMASSLGLNVPRVEQPVFQVVL